MVQRVALMVVLAGTCCAIAPTWAVAAAIPVTTTADAVAADGQCSLREAITAANTDVASGAPGECAAGAGADTITLPAGPYVLTRSGAPDDTNINGDLDLLGATTTVAGAGAATTVIDGGGIDRVFDVITGRTVTISGVTVTGGRAPGGSNGGNLVWNGGTAGTGQPGAAMAAGHGSPGAAGGGIRNAGSLTIFDSTVTGTPPGPVATAGSPSPRTGSPARTGRTAGWERAVTGEGAGRAEGSSPPIRSR